MSDDLPEGWASAKLGDAGEWGSGGTPSRSVAAYHGGDIPWVKSGDLKDGLLRTTEERITRRALEKSAAKLMPKGSVSIAMYGATIGKLAVLGIDAATNQACANCRVNEAVERWYLFYYLMSQREEFVNAGQGGAQPNISATIIKNWPFPVAPLAEQRRIVAKVEALLERVNAAREQLEKVPRLLKRFRQSVLAKAFRGELTEEWRLANEKVRGDQHGSESLEERRRTAWIAKSQAKGQRRAYKLPIEPTLEGVPEVPPNWAWASADALCSQVTDGEHIQPRYQVSGLPMLTATHVRDGYVEFSDFGLIAEPDFRRCLERCEPRKDDVLIVSVGATTGRAALVGALPPFSIVRSVLLLRPLIVPKFLLRWCQSPWCFRWMTEASGSTAQPHLYIGDTKRMPVPLPPEGEQREIVRRVDSLFECADTIEKRALAAMASANKLPQAILQRAFAGELVPTEAELAIVEGREFESAEELLRRLSATPNPENSAKSGEGPVTRRGRSRKATAAGQM